MVPQIKPTHQWLMAVGQFLKELGPDAGVWANSHAFRYGWFASRPPHYENCTYAKRTLQLYAELEHAKLIAWLGEENLQVELSHE